MIYLMKYNFNLIHKHNNTTKKYLNKFTIIILYKNIKYYLLNVINYS